MREKGRLVNRKSERANIGIEKKRLTKEDIRRERETRLSLEVERQRGRESAEWSLCLVQYVPPALSLVLEYISSYLQGLRSLVATGTSLCPDVYVSNFNCHPPMKCNKYNKYNECNSTLLHIKQQLSIVATNEAEAEGRLDQSSISRAHFLLRIEFMPFMSLSVALMLWAMSTLFDSVLLLIYYFTYRIVFRNCI